MDQKVIERAQLLSQESAMLEERAGFIDEQLQELVVFGNDLSVLEKNKESEILAPLGKGLYMKSQIADRSLFVNVGAGVLIKKSVIEARKVVDEQIKRLASMREGINARLVSIMTELRNLKNLLEKEKDI